MASVAIVALAVSSASTSTTSLAPGNAGQLVQPGPGRTLITSVEPGDAELLVAFEPPADPGGAVAIDDYEYSTDGGVTWRLRTDAAGPASPIRVTVESATGLPLANGTTYAMVLRPVQGQATGLPSNVVLATPIGGLRPPGAPGAVVAWASFQAAVVDWLPPADDGGAGVVSYTATAQPGGASCTVAAPAARCTIGNLANGVTYDVTVTATNSTGTGPASMPGATVSPRPLPGEPLGVLAVVDGQLVVVTWLAPTEQRGAPVTSYVVTAVPGGDVCAVAVPATSCPVVGLPADVPVAFTVRAVNNNGSGPPSLPSSPVVVP